MNGPKDKNLDSFVLTFMQRPVAITINQNHTINFQTDESSSVETMPMFYEGILLDYDDTYYYLGKTASEITQAITRSSVVHIQVMEEKNIYDQILEEMPDTPEGSEVN